MNREFELKDYFEKTLTPVLSFKPLFAFRNGIFSEIERVLMQRHGKIFLNGNKLRDEDFYKNFFKSTNITSEFQLDYNDTESMITPDEILRSFPQKISLDVTFLERMDYNTENITHISGVKSDVWIHNSSSVSPLVDINTKNGPVIIDQNVTISSFCILNGPLYIGPGSILDRVMISNSRAGRQCRLGGEISDSIIGDYTNKHHEGFLGHSIVGDWVNLGALTTTSDLKNNYGEIRLEYQNESFATNRIKFGSIIGDFVKTGIGSMLNTGTIIDVGSLLFKGFPDQKYFPPFFWGGEPADKYRLEKFLPDITKIMARRNCSPDDFLKSQLQNIIKQK